MRNKCQLQCAKRVNISVHDNKKLTVSKYRDLLYARCGENPGT